MKITNVSIFLSLLLLVKSNTELSNELNTTTVDSASLFLNFLTDNTEAVNTSVKEIAKDVVSLFGINLENASDIRFKELKEKLDKIDSFVIDKEKYAEILVNESRDHDYLNQTTFYDSLNKKEDFDFLLNKKPKNIYVQMKEKMNRDDIEEIVERHKSKSRRKMIVDDENDAEKQEAALDDILAKEPEDNHKFKAEDYPNPYWDPQIELEGRKEYLQKASRRIFKGERTSIRDYPFVVSIHLMKRFWCGGSLFSYDVVITSAACLQLLHNNRFFRENPSSLEVRVGTNFSRIGGESIPALEVFFHPSYNPRTLANNIAIIRLRRHLMYSYHRVPKLIRISESSHLLPATVRVLLLGFGIKRMGNKLSFEPMYLQRKYLPVYPNYFCKEVYGSKFITSKMFCAGTMTTGEGACDHDAGGPAILDGKLVGIISFGPAVCGFPNTPTVFTLVGAFSDWIHTINASMPDYYQGRARTTTTSDPMIDLKIKQDKQSFKTKSTTRKMPEIVTEPIPALVPMGDGGTEGGAGGEGNKGGEGGTAGAGGEGKAPRAHLRDIGPKKTIPKYKVV